MANNIIHKDCAPRMLCGRKVWFAERGGYSGAIKEVWVHFSPFHAANIYLKGSSLTDGDDEANLAYLEDLCREKIAKASPISKKLADRWDEEAAETAAYDSAEYL